MKDYSLITTEILEKRVEEIPWVLKIISSSDQAKLVSDNIAEEHDLNEEQSLMLSQLLGLVFNGFIKREEVITELVYMAELTEEEAGEIYAKLNDQIFRHVRKELDNVYFPFFENGQVSKSEINSPTIRDEKDSESYKDVLEKLVNRLNEGVNDLETELETRHKYKTKYYELLKSYRNIKDKTEYIENISSEQVEFMLDELLAVTELLESLTIGNSHWDSNHIVKVHLEYIHNILELTSNAVGNL